MTTPAGLLLARNLANLWSELRFLEFSPGSHISIAELEDALLANFVTALETPGDKGLDSKHQGSAQELARAEEFLDANLTRPVSRADLAAVAGVSIRTLSRGFLKRHGTGPMGFLKARRLDAVYRQLLGAETGSTTVHEVAARYGFTHLGRFAMEFKQTFGESPSVTLNG